MKNGADLSRPLLQALARRLLQGPLQSPATNVQLIVAYSGGLDSHVLLHALSRAAAELPQLCPGYAGPAVDLRALHINHGLSPHADAWQQHCSNVCRALSIPFSVQKVTIDCRPGDSLEEQARLARYAAFEQLLQPQQHLLLAHHLDDQAETLLLRLLRGAGPQGLSAMPADRVLGQGRLWRPLLNQPRSLLEDYARVQGLQWITDESNTDTRYDRNYLRQRVLPLLGQRWPSYRQSWLRSASLSAEADELNRELAALDLQNCRCEEAAQLDCVALSRLSPVRQRNVLRYWLRQLGFSDPGWHVLRRCVDEVLPAAEDAQPLLAWPAQQGSAPEPQVTQQLRRFQQRLYALRDTPQPEEFTLSFDLSEDLQKLDLPGNGTLYFTPVIGAGLKLPLHGLQIAYRSEGQSCRLFKRRQRPLKKILHEAAIPPWLRSRVPLLQQNGDIACILNIGCCEPYAAGPNDPGVLVHWQPPE